MKSVQKSRSSSALSAAFLVIGVFVIFSAIVFESEVAAFVGLGLVFWGVVFGLAKEGKYVESGLLEGTAKSAYSTFDRMINDLKFDGKGYFIPAYPRDVNLPDYLVSLRDPVVLISDSFNGKPSADEIAGGKFLSEKGRGVFMTCPGAELMAQVEKRVDVDFSKVDLNELVEFLPRCLTEMFNLAKSVDMSLTGDGAVFDASGLLYQSLYQADPPLKSLIVLGCPVVSAVASILAKCSGRTVVISEQVLSPVSCGVHAVFKFV